VERLIEQARKPQDYFTSLELYIGYTAGLEAVLAQYAALSDPAGPGGTRRTDTYAHSDEWGRLDALRAAYYAIPAGQPSDTEVVARLPALYAAIEAVLPLSPDPAEDDR
jgi:hypothetical protein